jgi:hypothetical protein
LFPATGITPRSPHIHDEHGAHEVTGVDIGSDDGFTCELREHPALISHAARPARIRSAAGDEYRQSKNENQNEGRRSSAD